MNSSSISFFLSCGGNHTICLTKSENCYSWGCNNNGQLGLGDNKNRNVPTLLILSNNEKILNLSSGNHHIICITKSENIYVWGKNESGQLGLGDRNDRNIPTLLALPNNEKIKFSNLNWTKSNHKHSSNFTKKIIKTILILNLKDKKTEKPKYYESFFYSLPKEIMIEIFQYLELY